jgi:hypothetical protein
MNRRDLLALSAAVLFLPSACPSLATLASAAEATSGATLRRVRSSDAGWPDVANWEKLRQAVGGRLIRV